MSSTSEIIDSLQLIINNLLNDLEEESDSEDNTHNKLEKFEVRVMSDDGSERIIKCLSYAEARLKAFELSEDFGMVHILDKNKGSIVASFNSNY